MKYFEFGNEQTINDAYVAQFEAMATAVWAADPNVIIVVGDFTYTQPIQNPFNFSGAASGITTLEAHQKIMNFAQQHGREVWFDVHVNTSGPGADPTLVALPTYVSVLDQISSGAAHKVVVFELNADVHDQARAVGNALAINDAAETFRDAEPRPPVLLTLLREAKDVPQDTRRRLGVAQ